MIKLYFVLFLTKLFLGQKQKCLIPTIDGNFKEVDRNFNCFDNSNQTSNGCNITANNGYYFDNGENIKFIPCNLEHIEEVKLNAKQCDLLGILNFINIKNCTENQTKLKLLGRCDFVNKNKYKLKETKSKKELYCLKDSTLNFKEEHFVEREKSDCKYPKFMKSKKSENCSEEILKGNCTLIANDGYYFTETNTSEIIITCPDYEEIIEPNLLPIMCNAFAPLELKGTLKPFDETIENSLQITEDIDNKKSMSILGGVILQCDEEYVINPKKPTIKEKIFFCKLAGKDNIDFFDINPCVKTSKFIITMIILIIIGIVLIIAVIVFVMKRRKR